MSLAVDEEKFYSTDQILSVKMAGMPKHVAIIMDGNRRYAKKNRLPPMAGHWKGADVLATIVRAAAELGIEVLTVYGFSTENWKRSVIEVKSLMHIFKTHLIKQREVMIDNGIRLNVIGNPAKFPEDVQEVLEETIQVTAKGEKMDLVLALNYGGRDEITRAVKRIVEDCLDNKLAKEGITEKLISNYLDTRKWKDPDLLIRTSGETRISNFLLWQISYCEISLTDTLWPEFSEKDLLAAICEYQKRELRIGR